MEFGMKMKTHSLTTLRLLALNGVIDRAGERLAESNRALEIARQAGEGDLGLGSSYRASFSASVIGTTNSFITFFIAGSSLDRKRSSSWSFALFSHESFSLLEQSESARVVAFRFSNRLSSGFCSLWSFAANNLSSQYVRSFRLYCSATSRYALESSRLVVRQLETTAVWKSSGLRHFHDAQQLHKVNAFSTVNQL